MKSKNEATKWRKNKNTKQIEIRWRTFKKLPCNKIIYITLHTCIVWTHYTNVSNLEIRFQMLQFSSFLNLFEKKKTILWLANIIFSMLLLVSLQKLYFFFWSIKEVIRNLQCRLVDYKYTFDSIKTIRFESAIKTNWECAERLYVLFFSFCFGICVCARCVHAYLCAIVHTFIPDSI